MLAGQAALVWRKRQWSTPTISSPAHQILIFVADPPLLRHYCENSAILNENRQMLVGSQRTWRKPTPPPACLQNSHQNGGRVFLIFVAGPRTARLCWNSMRILAAVNCCRADEFARRADGDRARRSGYRGSSPTCPVGAVSSHGARCRCGRGSGCRSPKTCRCSCAPRTSRCPQE